MADIFSVILFIITILTGLIWFLNKFITSHKDFRSKNALYTNNNNKHLKKDIISKIKQKQTWLDICISIFPVLLITLFIRSFIYEPFQIPSGSMMPTLLIGDFILVEKFSYGIRDPIFHKILFKTGIPKRGDVVIFKYPENPNLNYIKRVIGLPGDKITYNLETKEISIQIKCNSDAGCKNILPIKYSNTKLSCFFQAFKQNNDKKIIISFLELDKKESRKNGFYLAEREEILGNLKHSILLSPIIRDQLSMYYQQPGSRLATWTVPSGQYFMMGDNRDNSSDSRYWGFVPEKNLVGKATIIWMSLKKQENQWPVNIRLKHIGIIY